MKISYIITSENEEYKYLEEDNSEIIEVIISELSNAEQNFLEKNNIYFEKLNKNKIKIIIKDFINYTIESDYSNNGIF